MPNLPAKFYPMFDHRSKRLLSLALTLNIPVMLCASSGFFSLVMVMMFGMEGLDRCVDAEVHGLA